jgi:phosphatidylglycerophosphatase A
MPRLLASWFGSGLLLRRIRGSDAGSGTVGALVALIISLLLGRYVGWLAQLVAAALVLLVGLWAVRSLRAEGDAAWIVIDEAAATFLATTGLTFIPALVGFVVFRVADITKRPFPGVSQAEEIEGEWGVMADDLVAAVYGLVAGHILQALL